jgi:fructose-1-phosphate kinase PfkB-like protein
MILTVTLNLALDHLIFLERLKSNTVNRIEESTTILGGKGINIAATLAVLGDEVITTGFLSSRDSNYVEQNLQQLGITTNFLYMDSEIRTDTYIVQKEMNDSMLIIEKGDPIKHRFMEVFIENYKRVLNNVDTVIIAGSTPTGVGPDLINKLVDIANHMNKKVVLNCKEKYLENFSDQRKILVFKPDVRDTDVFDGLSYENRENRVKIANKMLKKDIEIFVLFYDEFKYFVHSKDESFEAVTNELLSKTKYLIGIEDGFLAGFTKTRLEGESLKESAKVGLACAIATSESINNYPESLDIVERHIPYVEINNL